MNARPPEIPSPNVYLYGMIVYSTIHRLAGDYPEADAYGEIEETHIVPGGETGNSALVLARLGCRVKVGGPFLGAKTRDGVVSFLEGHHIDCSGLHYDPDFDGVRDLVLVAAKSRTVFGTFGRYFRRPKRWSAPDETAIAKAAIVGLDPFFDAESERVATCCVESNRPYVTIDCAPDSLLHRGAAATVVANEYLRTHFPDTDVKVLLRQYASASHGLVIFTFGSREILYLRGNGEIRCLQPYAVPVKSTLGAGDTFRAGVIYGLLQEMDDTGVVKFAAATAAAVCQRFPFALDPPGLEEITGLIAGDRA
jgi:sugar/nucleoside kinase (ribokinase family)